jgi:hypothetical protein
MEALVLEKQKLATLCEIEGYERLDQLMEAAAFDSVSPAICMNDGCDYTCEMEPDQDRGWCEVCCTNTVKIALVLAGLI